MFHKLILYPNHQVVVNIRIYFDPFLSDDYLILSTHSANSFPLTLPLLNNQYLVDLGRSICFVWLDIELVRVPAILTQFVIAKLFLLSIILPHFYYIQKEFLTLYFNCSMIPELHVFFCRISKRNHNQGLRGLVSVQFKAKYCVFVSAKF